MKIVQVVAYYPPHLGGMENVAREISERLAKKGHQVEVFTSDIGCKKGKLRSTKNLKIHYLKSWEFAHSAIIPSLFFKLLKISKDSVIHVHVAQIMIPEIVYLVSKIKSIPYIAHIHADVGPSGKMGFLLPLYKNIFLKIVLKNATKIVVPSKDYVDLISRKYSVSDTKIYQVPNGVDRNPIKIPSAKLHTPIRLLYVGRFTKEKNIPLLIRSLQILLETRHLNIELHLVGEGEELKNIKRYIKSLNLENRVLLHGVLQGNKLIEKYKNSDIFVLTSSSESFGLVLLEAMASGLPIVSSNIPGVRNIINNGETGLLVTLTPENISSAIENIISDSKLREKLIEKGLDEVKKYNWNKIISKFEWIYKELIYDNNKK